MTEERRVRRRAYDVAYRSAHLAERRVYEAAYRSTHQAEKRAYTRAWRAAHLAERRKQDKRYKKRHRAEIRRQSALYYHNSRDKLSAWYSTPAVRLRIAANAAFRRARKAGIPYDEGLRDLLMAAPPTACACCEKALVYARVYGAGLVRRDSPSLDRVDNTGGYTFSNVQVICHSCNRLKNSASLADLEMLVTYMRKAGLS